MALRFSYVLRCTLLYHALNCSYLRIFFAWNEFGDYRAVMKDRKTKHALRALKNDKSLEHRVQGFYLYDKGENDELFYEISYPQPIYKYILTHIYKNVKSF